MAAAFMVTLNPKQQEQLKKLQEAMGVEELGEVIRRSIEVAELIHTLESAGYAVIAQKEGAPEKSVVIQHQPKFELKLVANGR